MKLGWIIGAVVVAGIAWWLFGPERESEPVAGRPGYMVGVGGIPVLTPSQKLTNQKAAGLVGERNG